MSDRTDFYFRQRVTEAELDLAFELLEKADRNLAADIGIYGIISGAVPTPHSPVADLTIDLTAPARAYDNLGQRIFFGTGQTVDCSVDHAGLPTDVPAAGHERWLGVFLRFERLLSDPRTDGNSQQVFFRRDESFEIVVRQAPPAAAGSATKVPLQPDELLVCDVRRAHGQTQILAADIDLSRRQAFIFAQGNAVQIDSSTWSALHPAIQTVQSALDAADAQLAGHFAGTSHRHPAAHIGYLPHGFVGASTVKDALDELIDDLSAITPAAGASRVGAGAVPGSPNALPAGNVGGQLAQLLGWLNGHLSAPAAAHNASAIAATPHAYVTGPSVQAQLQQIAGDLLSQSAPAGSARVGDEAISGSPNQLAAGTVRDHLVALLGLLNAHQSAPAAAHAASAIAVADAGGLFTQPDVEGALGELGSAFDHDHFGSGDPNAGQHKAIVQPRLGSGRVLLWDAIGNGTTYGRMRLYLDNGSVWLTINASWNGFKWVKDSPSVGSSALRLLTSQVEFWQQPGSGTAEFWMWSNGWRLPMTDTVNSAFELEGNVQEIGHVGLMGSNPSSSSAMIGLHDVVTFRNRFPAEPSSITLHAVASSTSWSGVPVVYQADRDGFFCYSFQSVASGGTPYWYGTYTAIA